MEKSVKTTEEEKLKSPVRSTQLTLTNNCLPHTTFLNPEGEYLPPSCNSTWRTDTSAAFHMFVPDHTKNGSQQHSNQLST